MNTKFSQAKSMKLPAVCHGSLIGLPVPYVDGVPQRLSCLAQWVDSTNGINLHESFDLNEDGGLPGWSGSSSDTGLNLKVTVERLVVPHTYTITIILRHDQSEQDDASWHDVFIAKGPPFESEGNRHDYPPGDNWDAVTLLD